MNMCATISDLPDKLSVVMRLLRQQLDLSPVKELMQGGERVLGDWTLVHITPHLQAHQGHADIQSPVELQVEGRKGEVG